MSVARTILIPGRIRTRLIGVSALALAATWATPTKAQVVIPGSPQCPIVDGAVTCTGDIRDGFASLTNTIVRRVVIRDLTVPVNSGSNPAVNIRASADITLDILAGVNLNVGVPNALFPAGIYIASPFTPGLDPSITINNAGNLTVGGQSAIQTQGGGLVQINNSGRISQTAAGRGILASAADELRVVNSGIIEVLTGNSAITTTQTPTVSISNSATGVINGNINLPNATTLAINNEGRIDGAITTEVDFDRPATNINFRNSGTITGGLRFIGAGNQNVIIDNLGPVGQSISYLAYATPRGTTAPNAVNVTINNRADMPFRTPTFPGEEFAGIVVGSVPSIDSGRGIFNVSITNSGNLSNNGIVIAPTFIRGMTARIVNYGSVGFITSSSADLLYLISGSDGTAGANHGTVSVMNTGRVLGAIFLFADRSIDLTNSGAATQIVTRQGHGEVSGGTGGYGYGVDFDAFTTISNSGAITLEGGRASDAIRAVGTANIRVDNTAAINSSGTTLLDGEVYFIPTGMNVEGQRNVNITSSAAIRANASDVPANFAGVAGGGVFLFELSFSEAQANRLRSNGFLDATYDLNADLNSQHAFATTADVVATGANMFGIKGNLGLIQDTEFPSDGSPFQEAFYIGTYGNALARLSLDIGMNSTISGGTRRGSGIYVVGTGAVTLSNAGVIVGNGDAGTGAVVVGGVEFREGNALADGVAGTALVNSLNTGTIRSANGYGIWAETGSITNFTNRGNISGGQAAIRAARDSSIINETGGTITGDILLESIGSDSVTNRGTINGRVSLGAGDDTFTLGTGGNLPTVDGGAGTDRFVVDSSQGNLRVLDIGALSLTSFELFIKRGLGIATLTGTSTSSLFNSVGVEAGTLLVNSALSGMSASVASGAILGGTGQLGSVTIADGAMLSPGGTSVGTLTMASLALSNGSLLRYDLGRAGTPGGADNDLVVVSGNLVLDGNLDVVAAPSFGGGVYRLINYGGTLTDNGLTVGVLPDSAKAAVQTSVVGQVNLVVDGGNIQFWDGGGTAPNGTVDGGSGVWNSTATNWTNLSGTSNVAWNSRAAVFQGASGTVTIDSAGVMANALQFVSNGYRIEGGTLTLTAPAALRVGDGTTSGSATTATIASVIAGSGGIEKTDFGTLVLTGANTYSGGTRVSGGVLSIAADSALGAVSGGLALDGGTLRTTAAMTSARGIAIGAGGGTLDVGANAVTLSSALTGAGALNVLSSGVLTVSGNSGSRTGATRIGGGTLALSGTLGGPVTIASGATLTGTGTTGNLIVEGTVSPDNSPGTLNVNGNLTFATGSTYRVELAATGPSDRINVTGTATLNGGTVAVSALDPERNYTNGASYRFIEAAGGLIGRFAGISENSAFLDFALNYSANSADVTVTVIRTFPEVARTFNQINAANGLRDLDKTPASDAFNIYRTILFSDENPARAAFDSASGEIYAVALASAQSSRVRAVNKFGMRATTGARSGWTTWGGVTGHQSRVDSDGNGATYKDVGTGGELGIDYRGASNAWAIGIGGGRVSGDIKLNARASQASNDAWHVGGFGRYGSGGAGFTAIAAASYGESDYNVTRAVTIASINRNASAQTSSRASGASIEGRYGFTAGNWAYGPVATISSGRANLSGFSETGADSLNLSSGANRDTNQLSSVGAFVNLQNDKGTFDVSVLYAKRDEDPTQVRLTLAGSPTTFSQRAAIQSGDTTIVRASGDYSLGGGWTLGGNLGGQFGDGDTSLSGSATLSLKF